MGILKYCVLGVEIGLLKERFENDFSVNFHLYEDMYIQDIIDFLVYYFL